MKLGTPKIDFEGFLMEKHAEQYIGTKDCMIDDFAGWVQGLEVDDFIKYGDTYIQIFFAQKEKRIKELQTVLSCWYNTFGTTQLTHASEAYESVKRELERAKFKIQELEKELNK